MRNTSSWFLSFFLVFVLIWSACQSGNGPEATNQSSNNNGGEERGTQVAAVEVNPRDLSQRITISNNVEARRIIQLSSQMTGVIEQVEVEEGDRLREGQVLAQINVAEQEAELARARANYERDRSAYERVRELHQQDLASTEEYEQKRTELAIAESEVELWETRVSFGTIRAPANVVVTDKRIEAGNGVSSNEVLFELADVSELVVRAGVSELNVAYLDRGQPSTVRIDAFPNREFEGTIRRVFPSADADSRLVPVEVAINPAGETIRPGYLARVDLAVDAREGVFAIPREALLASADEDEAFVFVINSDDELERRPVATGVTHNDWTEIVDGLQEGEQVVASNPARLEEGTRVYVASTVTHSSDPAETELVNHPQ